MNAIANLKNADTNRMDAITRRNVGNAQIQNLAADTAKKVEERTGIHLDNVTKARVMEFTVGQYKAALQKTQAETDDINSSNYWRREGYRTYLKGGRSYPDFLNFTGFSLGSLGSLLGGFTKR